MSQPFQSYGTTYNSSSYYPQYQQYVASQPQPGAYSPQAPPQMSAYQGSPAMNFGRFDGNTQHHPPPNFHFPGPSMNPEAFKQFASTVPPPPPPNFPPVPIPNMGYPQFQHNSASVANTPNHQNMSQPSYQPADNDAYDPRFPQHIPRPPFFVAAPTTTHSDKQEMRDSQNRTNFGNKPAEPAVNSHFAQINQGAFDGNRYPSTMDGSTFSSQVQYQPRSFDPPALHAPQPIHTNISNTLERQTQQMSEAQDVTPTAKPPSPISTSMPANQAATKESDPQPNHTPDNDTAQTNYAGKSVSDLRGLAKGAVSSFLQNGIHFASLVKEGVDAKVLQGLYKELNVAVPEARSDEDVSIPTNAGHDTTTRQPRPPSPAVTNTGMMVEGTHTATSHTVTNTNQATAATMSETVTSLAKPPVVPSPGLERKDRIAQLLAAKAGRPSPSRSASESNPSPAPNESQEAQAQSLATSDATKDDAITQQPAAVVAQEGSSLQSALQALRSGKLDSSNAEDSEIAGVVPKIDIPSHDAVLPSPLASSIPGLFMSSMELTQSGQEGPADNNLLSDNANESRTSQKRPYDADSDVRSGEPATKRQNTMASNVGSDVMAVDEQDGSNASEGEIVENSGPVSSAEPAVSGLQGPLIPSLDVVPQQQVTLPKPGQKLTPQQLAEKAAMLKARFLKQRAERQKELQDGLPGLNAEVQKTRSRLQHQQSRLNEIRTSIVRLGQDLADAKTQEQEILRDITSLESQVEEGVSGQDRFNDELRRLSTSGGFPKQSVLDSETRLQESSELVTTSDTRFENDATKSSTIMNSENLTSYQDRDSVSSSALPAGSGGIVNGDKNEEAVNEGNEVHEDITLLDAENGTAAESDEAVMQIEMADVAENTQGLPDEASHDVDYDLHEVGEYPLTQAQRLAQAETTPYEQTSVDSQMDDDEGSDGSVSMSDSGSEVGEDDYEPADNEDSETGNQIDVDESDEYDPEEIEVETEQIDSNDENLEVHKPVQVQPPSRSPGSQISEELIASTMNNAPQVELQAQNGELPEHDQKALEAQHSTAQNSGPPSSVQPKQEMMAISPPPALHASNTVIRPLSNEGHITESFTPYQSPLSAFQSYRYNQQFNQTAKDGFRSLTYSNNINPGTPLCQTELSGGDCQDRTCQDQHFRHLGLTDDQILVQMSSAQDITDKAARERYLNGLKEVIANLRQQGVKEFENVATALSTYRRQFFAE